MNDRLKIASEQLAALLLAAADHGVTDCPTGMTQAEFLVGAALSYADALIAAAGEQEKNDGWHALSARQHDAIRDLEAKCAALEAESAAWKNKAVGQEDYSREVIELRAEVARLRRQAEPLTEEEGMNVVLGEYRDNMSAWQRDRPALELAWDRAIAAVKARRSSNG